MISYNFVKAITIFSFEYSNNKKNIPLVLVVCCPQPKTPTSLREPNVWFYNKAISVTKCVILKATYYFRHEFTDLHKFSKKFNC